MKTVQSERASQVPTPKKFCGLSLVPNILIELETHFPTDCLPVFKVIKSHSQNDCPIHKKARWCPRASQREVSRTQSHFPFSQGKKAPKTQCSLSHSTRQTAFNQHVHHVANWSNAPVPLDSMETTYRTLHIPTCKLLCSWSALPHGYLHMRPAPQGW